MRLGGRPRLDFTKSNELSPREKQVLRLVAQGYTNKEIAKKLRIALSTVKNHVRSIMEKKQAKSRIEACEKCGLSIEEQDWRESKRILESALAHSYLCDGRMIKVPYVLHSIIGACQELLDYLQQYDDDECPKQGPDEE